jgi:hypothetical protein
MSGLRKLVLASNLILIVTGSWAQSQTKSKSGLAGDWQGDLTPALSVVVHITGAEGEYSATTDSPKQGAKGFKTTVTVEGKKVNLKIETPQPSTFVGTLDGNKITGTFSQAGGSGPLTLTKTGTPASKPGSASGLSGDWQGDLTPALSIVLHVSTKGSGYTATTDSPKQGLKGFNTTISVEGNTVTLKIATPVPSSYVGTLKGNTISGTFYQGGGSGPLVLTKADSQSKKEKD